MARRKKTSRLRRSLTFRLQQFLLRGPLYRVLAIWFALFLIALAGGIVALMLPGLEFAHLGEAVWWAFLHLSDSGYLGDDEPEARFLGIVLTVLGLVVFVGALIAIMTQWFSAYMERLALGMTPIRAKDHVVVLGWTDRTLELLDSLLRARGEGEVSRAVVLVEELTSETTQSIRERLGPKFERRGQLILRSGDARLVDHLARVDCGNARAILLPADGTSPAGPRAADADALRIVATLARSARSDEGTWPLLAVEIFDSEATEVVRGAYPGDAEVVASEDLIGRCIAEALVSPGASQLSLDLIDTSRGLTVRLESCPELAGETLQGVIARLPRALVLGVLRGAGPAKRELHIELETVLRQEDELLLIAPVEERLEPEPAEPAAVEAMPEPLPAPVDVEEPPRNILILGWSGKVPRLLRALAAHSSLEVRADVVSLVDPAERTALVEAAEEGGRVSIRHLTADVTSPRAYREVDLTAYDSLAIVATDQAYSDGSRDSGTLAAYFLLSHALRSSPTRPHVVLELIDPGSASLFDPGAAEIVETPVVVAAALASVVTHQNVSAAFGDVLGGELGALRSLDLVALVGTAVEVSVASLDRHLRSEGKVLVARQSSDSDFRPEPLSGLRGKIPVSPGDHVVVFERHARP